MTIISQYVPSCKRQHFWSCWPTTPWKARRTDIEWLGRLAGWSTTRLWYPETGDLVASPRRTWVVTKCFFSLDPSKRDEDKGYYNHTIQYTFYANEFQSMSQLATICIDSTRISPSPRPITVTPCKVLFVMSTSPSTREVDPMFEPTGRFEVKEFLKLRHHKLSKINRKR